MSIPRPYKRLVRPTIYGTAHFNYYDDPHFAPDFLGYSRAFRLLEADLRTLYDFIEPADLNANTYSHRTFELFLRAATEFEANAKRILQDNQAMPTNGKRFTIYDYWKLEKACRLSEYTVDNILWDMSKSFRPFDEWRNTSSPCSLVWYQAYNAVKHDRPASFDKANLLNVTTAVAATLILLYAQMGPKCVQRTGHAMYQVEAVPHNSKALSDEFLWVTGMDMFFTIYPPKWPASDQYDVVDAVIHNPFATTPSKRFRTHPG